MRLIDVLDLRDFGLRPLAGHALLDRPIDWVYTTDLLDPRRYLAGGELVLTGSGWRDGPDVFVQALSEGRAAGLVTGVESDALVDACDRHGLPLFGAPPETSYGELSRAIIDRLASGRGRTLTDLVHRQRGLAVAAVTEGIPGILGRVKAATGRNCVLLSPAGRRIAGDVDAFDRNHCYELAETARGRGRHGLPLYRPLGDRVGTVLPCGPSDRAPEAFLLCDVDLLDGPETGFALVDLAAELCTPDAVQKVSELPAWETVSAYVVHATVEGGSLSGDLLGELTDGAAAVRLDSGLAGTGYVDVAANARRLGALLPPGARLIVGVAGASGLSQETAVRQARTLHRLASERPDRVSVLDDSALDASHLLTSALPGDLRSLLRERTVGPVIAYDRSHGTDLLDTLRAFLDCDGSWQRCAERLHVHVNTLHYRISRIEQLTGRSVKSMEDRVQLYLAVRL